MRTPIPVPPLVTFPSDIGDFEIGFSPIEGRYHRGSCSSAIGLFCIGCSPIGMEFVPVPDRRRVIFQLPEWIGDFDMPEPDNQFVLPIPEGWAS